MLAEAAAVLRMAGIDEPRRRARWLLAGLLELSPSELVSHPEREIEAVEGLRLRRSLARMVRGEPLSRILGWREFWGLDFALSPDTLDPRPESETMVEAVLARIGERAAPLTILDLGTGTGCLLLALLSEFPAASGIGIDLSAGAAATARRNAEALGLGHRARFAVGSWGSALSARFDVIVANPPYIARAALAGLAPEVVRYDPRLALDGGDDGLAAYRQIAAEMPERLAGDGVFAARGRVWAGHRCGRNFRGRGSLYRWDRARSRWDRTLRCGAHGRERLGGRVLARSKKSWNVPWSRLGWALESSKPARGRAGNICQTAFARIVQGAGTLRSDKVRQCPPRSDRCHETRPKQAIARPQ